MKPKIKFKKIAWKNFLSFGNYWTEVALDTGKITVITGKNGEGKSVIEDAIYFALTGFSYRKIGKYGLINNINNKRCQVVLEFTTNNKDYVVKRGLRPNVFSIIEDGKILPQEGKNVDYHQELLNKITSLNPDLIRNIILISSSLKSFFVLRKNEKRNLSDVLFGLSRFNRMFELQKAKSQEIALKTNEKEHELAMLKKTEEHQNQQMQQYNELAWKIKDQKSRNKRKIEGQARKNVRKIESEKKRKNSLEERADKIKDKMIKVKTILEEFSNLDSLKIDLENHKKKRIESTCSKCGQPVSEEIKTRLNFEVDQKIKETSKKISESKAKITRYDKKELNSVLTKLNDRLESIRAEERNIEIEIHSLENITKRLDDELKMFDIKIPEKPKIDVKSTTEKVSSVEKELKKLGEMSKYLKITNKILLSDELKSFIIRNYIPFLNEQMNKYLELFNFDAEIAFDTDLEFKFLSRKYQGYEYNNFSNGQKMRLSLALLFTVIQLNKLINFGSLNLVSNVLCIDEFLDHGLDVDGMNDCIHLLNEKNKKEAVSIFLISQRVNADNTDFLTMKAYRKNGFSYLTKE